MIFIVVKWSVRPERADEWLDLVDDFTQATRAEDGNIFFEWSRSVDDPNTFVLVEAFADGEAGGRHVSSDHFKAAVDWMPDVVAATPEIINVEIPDASGWSEMGEVKPRGDDTVSEAIDEARAAANEPLMPFSDEHGSPADPPREREPEPDENGQNPTPEG